MFFFASFKGLFPYLGKRADVWNPSLFTGILHIDTNISPGLQNVTGAIVVMIVW